MGCPPLSADRAPASSAGTICQRKLVKIRFLLDENLPPRLKTALLRLNAEIDVLRVGDPGVPDLGAPDPNILDYLQTAQRVFVTDNRKSIPAHLAAHIAAGKHHWGIIWVRPSTRFSLLVNELHMLWEASQAEEWVDRTDWLPL